MNDFEALGTAIEGGANARAIEPEHGEGETRSVEETLCANCGTQLVGPHCHGCGQKAHIHRTLGAIGHDLIHGVLHLDGKFWRTLPLLTWKPGELTRRYIDGERAKFVSPMAMFLFTVFAMFAIFSILGLSMTTDLTGAEATSVSAREEMESEIAKLEKELQRDDLTAERREELELDREGLQQGLEVIATMPGLGSAPNSKTAPWRSGWDRLDKGIEKWRENPGLMLYKLQTNAYKFSWLLIPISLPFMWLLFAWRRRFKMYDHAVFVTYSISFVSLLLILLTLGVAVGLSAEWLFLGMTLIVPVHMWRQLKGAYGLGWFSATWRTITLLFIINGFVIGIFAMALFMLGLLG